MSGYITFSNLCSLGSCVPSKELYNQQLTKMLNVNDNWITEHIGVRKRNIASNNEDILHLSTLAAKQALVNAGCSTEDLDCIIVVTATAEYQFPGISCLVKEALDIKNAYAFDITGSCGGFISAFNIANNAIKCNQAKKVLIIGVDTLTKVVSWEEPTSALFGDGAGAIILAASNHKNILDIILRTDSKYSDLLTLVNSNISAQIPKIIMQEEHFIINSTKMLAKLVKEVLFNNDLNIYDLDWLVPQQIHIKILRDLINTLGIDEKKLILTIGEHANTGAASIPLSLEYAVQSNLFKSKDKILLLEVSSGLTAGVILIECNDEWFYSR